MLLLSSIINDQLKIIHTLHSDTFIFVMAELSCTTRYLKPLNGKSSSIYSIHCGKRTIVLLTTF